MIVYQWFQQGNVGIYMTAANYCYYHKPVTNF